MIISTAGLLLYFDFCWTKCKVRTKIKELLEPRGWFWVEKLKEISHDFYISLLENLDFDRFSLGKWLQTLTSLMIGNSHINYWNRALFISLLRRLKNLSMLLNVLQRLQWIRKWPQNWNHIDVHYCELRLRWNRFV